MDNGNVPIAVFLDLSKTFDTLPYHWQNYSSMASKISIYNGLRVIKSDTVKIPIGVPQGSIYLHK